MVAPMDFSSTAIATDPSGGYGGIGMGMQMYAAPPLAQQVQVSIPQALLQVQQQQESQVGPKRTSHKESKTAPYPQDQHHGQRKAESSSARASANTTSTTSTSTLTKVSSASASTHHHPYAPAPPSASSSNAQGNAQVKNDDANGTVALSMKRPPGACSRCKRLKVRLVSRLSALFSSPILFPSISIVCVLPAFPFLLRIRYMYPSCV